MSQNQTSNDQNIHNEQTTPKKERQAPPIPIGFARGVPVLLLALAVFLTLCFMTQDTGAVGKFISSFLLGLFSYAAYALPLLIAIHGIFYYADLHYGRRLSRLIFSIVTVVGISSLIYVIRYWGQDLPFTFGKYYTDGQNGAGLIGSIVAFCLMKVIGSVGVIILTVAVLALYVIYFFGKGKNAFAVIGLKLLTLVMSFFSFIEKKVLHLKKKGAEAKDQRKTKAMREIGNELSDDDYFAVDNGMQELSIPELGILEVKSRRSIEENPTLHERVRHKNAQAQKESAEKSFYTAQATATAKEAEEPHVQAEEQAYTVKKEENGEHVIYNTPFEEKKRPSMHTFEAEPTAPKGNVACENSADSVFTKDFDPFNITLNTTLASKKSSRAAEAESTGFKTEEDALPNSPEEAEKRLRAMEFEKKRKQILEQRQKQFEAAKAAKAAADAEKERAAAAEAATKNAFTSNAAENTVQKPTVTYAPECAPERPERTVTVEEKATERTEEKQFSFGANAARTETAFTKPEQPQSSAPAAMQSPAYGQSAYQAPAQPQQAPAYAPQPYPGGYQMPPQQTPAYGATPYPPYTNPYGQYPYPPQQAPVYPPQQPPEYPSQPAYGAPPAYGQPYAPAQAPAPNVNEFHTAQAQRQQPSAEQNFRPFPTEPTPTMAKEEPASIPMEREMIFSAPEDEIVAEDPKPIPPEEQNPAVLEYRNRFSFLREEAKENVFAGTLTEEDAVLHDKETEEEEEDAPPFDNATDVSAAFNSFRQRDTSQEATFSAKELRPNYADYKLPSLDLLAKGSEEVDEGILTEIQERQEKLIDALASFNVTASIKGVDRGPRVTRYEVVPAKGTKSNAITNLFDDICMALAAKGVRMEPIPERSAIGFEIPNKKPQTVRLRDLIESEEFLSKTSKTSVCIGKDVTGNPVFGDIAKMPHVLVAGATGMGKSVCINAILISMLYKARPDEVKLILVDPKKVEFNVYNGIPHLLIPVVTDPKQAAGALMWAVEQMEKRYDMIEKLCVRNIEAYNAKVKENPELGEPMPKIVIVIDELNDLMIQVRDPVENLIMSIAQKARAAGIHLIIGTQRPSVNVITGVIKANIPSRISCKVSASVDSRTILERAGAEKLLNNGDMLFHPVGLSDPIRVQGAFVTDAEVEAVMEALKKQNKGNSYDEQAIEDINRAAKKCSKKKDSDYDSDDGDDDGAGEGYLNDQKFLDAVDVAIKNQKIATSLIQRKLSIGYGKAAKYIDVMESLGIVGEANGPKPREVLITMDEWHEMLARRDLD